MASIFRGLEEDNYDRQYTDGQLYRRIAGYFASRSGKFLSFVGLALLSSFLLGIEPILISEVVRVLENRTILSPVYLILGILTMNILIEYGANWLRRRLAGRTISGVVADMRKEAFQAAIYRDLAFYDKNKTGKILSRISNDTQEFGTIVLISSDIISQIISVMILLVVLFRRDVTLTLWLLGTIPLLVGLSMVFRHWAKITTRNGSRALGLVNDNIQESVAGIAVAKNFRKEKMIYDEFLKVNNTSYRVNVVRGGVLSLVFPSLNVMAGLVIALIVYLGANRVFAQQINVSTWFLFVLAVDRFFFPAITLSSFISQIQQGLSSVERVFSLIDYQNEVQQIAKQPITRRLEGKIEFKQVGFGYTPEHPVFQEFSLTIAPKEKLAIVGHTGSGKSSLAKLVTRFYEFQSGQLLIDGVDIRSLDVSAYRQQLGIVSQTPFVFSGSIRDYIRYSKPNITDEEMMQLAMKIGNGEWLDALPNGLDTDVGERGARLSLGQRQLVSLMRVLLQKPAIFILDEATASVDPFTESQIKEALDLILKQSTSILIAHRLSTVKSADRILVLDHGQIIEQGNHESLMAKGGHYSELYNTYFRHQSLSYVEASKQQFALTSEA